MTHDEQCLIDDILATDSGLTGWEMDFVEELDRSCRECSLSEKQRDKLNQIAEKLGLGGLV